MKFVSVFNKMIGYSYVAYRNFVGFFSHFNKILRGTFSQHWTHHI